MTKMAEYRVYRMDKAGHIDGPPDGIICASDEAAIERAKRLVNGHDIEVWQLDRLVVRLPSKDR
jgi:hypothetical protein